MEGHEELRARLMTMFRLEAADHLQSFIAGLLRLEQDPGDAGTIARVYRAMHSLKGAASVVGQTGITHLCQALETYFSALQSAKLRLHPDALEVLHRAADQLGSLLDGTLAAVDDAFLQEVNHLSSAPAADASRAAEPSSTPLSAPSPPRTGASATEPRREGNAIEAAAGVRVSPERIAEVLWHSEQMAARVYASDWADAVRRIRTMVLDAQRTAGDRSRSRLRSDGSGPNSPAVIAGEHDRESLAQFLRDLDPAIANLERVAQQQQRTLSREAAEMAEAARSLSLSPAQTLLDAFPKVVRDLAHSLSKQVRVEIEGGDLELDRRLLDHLRAPLLHLLRNAVGHGIEPPTERGAKNSVGLIRIVVRLADDQRVEVTVSDDGVGIDSEGVVRYALRAGLIDGDGLARMDEQQRLALVFLPGLSTRDEADRISGRGLGLSIVQERIGASGGSVTVESTRGEGTTFRLLLPLRVATLRGILVACGEFLLAVPEASVHHVIRIPVQNVRRSGAHRVVEVEGRALPVVRLAEVLRVAAPPTPSTGYLQVLLIGTPAPLVALHVDAILRSQEFMLKQPQPPFQGIHWYLGMTVIGRGRVIPVLQPSEFIRFPKHSAAPAEPRHPDSVAMAASPSAPRRLSILIAEDSITSRIFLKNLLESKGHSVTGVGDGDDAWNALRRGSYDIVLTDVEMPSLDGYALTERIRGESRIADLPVVLITALDSPEHRKRGMAAGADAYLVKNQFDHEQLLDTIARLVYQ